MNIKHDLSERAVVGHIVRECDETGAVVALTISDQKADVQIGIRIRTLAQARALREAAEQAEQALREEMELLAAVELPAHLRTGTSRTSCQKCGGRLFSVDLGLDECAACGTQEARV